MGRGISDLQRGILSLLIEKKFLSFQELLCLMWGWEPAEWGSKKAAVGENEYNAAYATLSRSLDRLWRRKLIEFWKTLTHYRTGVTLTDEGKVMAQAIFTEDQKEQFNG